MRPLIVSNYGVNFSVSSFCLNIKSRDTLLYSLKPHKIPYDSIVLDSPFGNISLEALRFLNVHNMPIMILNYKGDLQTLILPNKIMHVGELRLKQLEAYTNQELRFCIAREFVRAKTGLEPIGNNIEELIQFEGRIAGDYFTNLGIVRERPASDMINASFNFGYAILEGYCRFSIHAHGLEPSIGFLHSIRRKVHKSWGVKEPLVYDFQELFRSDIDRAVLNTRIKRGEYYRTDDYHIKLREDAITKLVANIQSEFNFRDLNQSVFTFCRFLKGQIPSLSFSLPSQKIRATADASEASGCVARNITPRELLPLACNGYFLSRRLAMWLVQ